MSNLQTAAQQALEALEKSSPQDFYSCKCRASQHWPHCYWKQHQDAIKALRAALAEPVQEAVQEPIGNSYADLFNALQRIETAAVFLPSFKITHEGGIAAVVQNIVDAIAALAEPTTEESSAVEPVQEPVACLIGTKNSAFDSPTTKRAYTYAEQPGNVVASRLGLACNAAASQSAGDSIDRGLGLLQELQRQGFGVFDLGAEYAAPPQRKPLTEEEISSLWDGHVVPVFGKNGINPIVFARAVERAHGIGGEG